ncbi:hypothetical protein DYBT9275_01855 [Dyadobacter sp. CECT 9275]|uniref:DUF2147 domain-containing protein n=1 Tax=Dyadobacter helix TaxID=2822344 RepID=A0A916JB10_9BACT|nr:DUF2147 domain-containing protein [Dyadobacter sp. CECT 9275]CAG4997806.1 hypothetical protein DYBT9275_01855 [Dyadobacter sp. CECT 9275]
MKKIVFLLAISFFSFVSETQHSGADAIVGVWLSEEKDGKIEVYRTGNKYNGKIIWGKELMEADGKTSRKDIHNPDKKLRARSLENMVILSDFEYTGSTWENGTIYDPHSGKTYSCIIKLKGQTLEIRGFVGISLLGRTTYWKRDTE